MKKNAKLFILFSIVSLIGIGLLLFFIFFQYGKNVDIETGTEENEHMHGAIKTSDNFTEPDKIIKIDGNPNDKYTGTENYMIFTEGDGNLSLYNFKTEKTTDIDSEVHTAIISEDEKYLFYAKNLSNLGDSKGIYLYDLELGYNRGAVVFLLLTSDVLNLSYHDGLIFYTYMDYTDLDNVKTVTETFILDTHALNYPDTIRKNKYVGTSGAFAKVNNVFYSYFPNDKKVKLLPLGQKPINFASVNANVVNPTTLEFIDGKTWFILDRGDDSNSYQSQIILSSGEIITDIDPVTQAKWLNHNSIIFLADDILYERNIKEKTNVPIMNKILHFDVYNGKIFAVDFTGNVFETKKK